MDTVCVELRYTDGMIILIDCTEEEFEVTHSEAKSVLRLFDL